MQSKEEQYIRILEGSNKADYLSPSQYTADAYQSTGDKTFVFTTSFVTGPVLLSYVSWVLNDAVKRGIKKLFFIARDGYVMKEIAEELIKNKDITLHYLYCSRYVIRQSLFVIDPEYALDKCCSCGSYVTAEKVLQRVGLDSNERDKVLACIQEDNPYEPLDRTGLSKLKQRLQSCGLFWEYSKKHARIQLDQMLAYFQQEAFDDTRTAIVDSGWLGSMQAGLQKILSYNAGCKVELTGYYFGMYKREDAGGFYRCYFFSETRGFSHIAHFNCNLFECLCAANHGMTTGYRKVVGRMEPLFGVWESPWNVQLQLDICKTYARLFASKNAEWYAEDPANVDMVSKLLCLFIKRPSKDEAVVYGRIPFDDDAFENRLIPLACPLSKTELSNLLLFRRLYRKIRRLRSEAPFWIEGTLALSENVPFLYRLDFKFQNYIINIKNLFTRLISK